MTDPLRNIRKVTRVHGVGLAPWRIMQPNCLLPASFLDRDRKRTRATLTSLQRSSKCHTVFAMRPAALPWWSQESALAINLPGRCNRRRRYGVVQAGSFAAEEFSDP